MATPDRPITAVSLDPDPVIEAFKRHVDRTLLRENLKLTPDERLRKLQAFVDALDHLRRAERRRSPTPRERRAARVPRP